MSRISKALSIIIITVLAASSIVMVEYASGSTKPSTPEFTMKLIDKWYDVPPTTSSSTNPYTNETTTTTIPGRHVENKTVIATIKNNIGASYYNFRYKGHYGEEWSYFPSDPDSVNGYNHYDSYGVPYQASNSSHTVISLHFLQSIPNGEVDIQMQALFGNYRAVPYGHVIALPAPTYDFYFEGTTSDWSSTQTIKIGEGANTNSSANASPSQSDPVFPSASPSTALPQSTATPTEPSKEIAQNTALFGLNWVEVGILVLLAVIVVLLAVSLRRKSGKKTALVS